MKRRWFTVAGVVSVVIAVVAAALFHGYVLQTPALGVWIATFLVSGVLVILGGESRSVAGLTWYQLLGLGHVTLGVGMAVWFGWSVLSHWGDVSAVALDALLAIIGPLVMVGIGVLWIRGTDHMKLELFEPGPIFGSRTE